MKTRIRNRALILIAAMIVVVAGSTQLNADTGMCGGASITLPFTDVPAGSVFFCSIAEAYFSGLTNGTDATHYSPSANVPREQMAAFVTRTMDQSVKRAGKRAALDQFWTNSGGNNLALTTVGSGPALVKSDGADVWVANNGSGTVSRVRASDGKALDPPWTGATGAFGVLVAVGKIFVTGGGTTNLYQLDPTLAAGAVTTVTSSLGTNPAGIAFDGQRIWTANQGGSVSIVTLSSLLVTTVTTGFNSPVGIIYDGANIWVTDYGDGMLKKLDTSGTIVMSVPVGIQPGVPAFDGTNIWVPNFGSNSVSVVRATGSFAGTVLTTLTGTAPGPTAAAFDGERILVTNQTGNVVTLWKASDLTPIGAFPTGTSTTPVGVCSDGTNFWITFNGAGKLARF